MDTTPITMGKNIKGLAKQIKWLRDSLILTAKLVNKHHDILIQNDTRIKSIETKLEKLIELFKISEKLNKEAIAKLEEEVHEIKNQHNVQQHEISSPDWDSIK